MAKTLNLRPEMESGDFSRVMGIKVKTRGGKEGVIERVLGGYMLVRFPGGDHPYGYLPDELEVVEG